MAEKRMFSKAVIDSDVFLDMPLTAQALYFHLAMRADDDGFVDNPKKIQRMIGASDDDLKLLIAKQFIIVFENGIIVIRHWRLHNYLRKDRYKPTIYQDELQSLNTDDSGVYSLGIPCGIPTVDQMATQYSIDKSSIDKSSIEKEIYKEKESGGEPQKPKKTKPQKHKYGEYENVLLSDRELEILKRDIPDWQSWIEQLSVYMRSTGKSYKDHLATIKNWKRKRDDNNTNAADNKKWCTDNEPSADELIAGL